MTTKHELIALAALALLAGCPKSSASGGGGSEEVEDFRCNGRSASYMVVGSFTAPEAGIAISCASGTKLTRWTVDDEGKRDEQVRRLSQSAFDEYWQQLDDAGWRNLTDCESLEPDSDQVYTFDISDEDSRVTLTCAGKTLPFPFDRLVLALDLAARETN